MTYRVTLRPAAARDLSRQRAWAQLALEGAILSLGDDPRPRGAIKLSGSSGAWRVRVTIDGIQWRLVYEINDPQQSVRVLRITRRNESTYRGM
ncbi:MAG: type II toxin-antitoxin system RelE/ParE family toxin [Chloroflexota bacterium]